MMKRVTLPVTIVVLALFLFSCASMSPNAKLLVGSWKPVSAEKYVEPTKETKAPKSKTAADTTKVSNNPVGSSPDMNAQQKSDAEWGRMVNTEKRTPLTIHADKTLEKPYHQKTVKATWKLKRHGTRILIEEATTGQKLKGDIVSITDSTLQVIERLPMGDIKVDYVKVK